MTFHPSDFFDLSKTAHAALFDDVYYVWEVLDRIGDYLRGRLASDLKPNTDTMSLHPSVVIEGDVYIGNNVQIAPATFIQGPTIIEDNSQIRHGAFVRENTLVATGAVVGHSTETKNAVFLEGAMAPHFAYVGDSILGRRVNLGAGTKLSNFPMNGMNLDTGEFYNMTMTVDGETIDTGTPKIGAILGDDVQLGCNCVTNPGTFIGAGTLVYALTALRKGVYPANSIIKLRQTQEIVEQR